jgi:hypothetical protein
MAHKVAVMPPYFFPYIGYFQLLNAVDTYVIYDDIEFTKGKYFNRNTLLFNGNREIFTVNLDKASDFALIGERHISEEYRKKTCAKILAKIQLNYRKAPYFNEVYPMIEVAFKFPGNRLFDFGVNSMRTMMDYLDISTKLIVSSTLPIASELKNKDKLFAILKQQACTDYWNPEGGVSLYNQKEFSERGMTLNFLMAHQTPYSQIHSAQFQPYLSVIDVMMHCKRDEIKQMLLNYSIKQ